MLTSRLDSVGLTRVWRGVKRCQNARQFVRRPSDAGKFRPHCSSYEENKSEFPITSPVFERQSALKLIWKQVFRPFEMVTRKVLVVTGVTFA